jgi:hypothetical protein
LVLVDLVVEELGLIQQLVAYRVRRIQVAERAELELLI